ncbi:fumarylacetoacetate hydrolase family protein [Dietzia sp. PP-33]|mgnify:CR=1 FL=1|jgi:2-keto-4-pentenoate hydratase/2-oxohepta-3-ene-1,7-dioic acid hydratase in catechol pathway|uniref:fumarylacetoacetate hydrolase family protein n=1 Tax=Dietzia sp. PP-33 TaxID=2957500 RepID=UPI0029A5DFFD|nr:fumarylacetoacetate hydrolase family protein [Dietzia sp. PP-33]MDX2356519.1 fumarylacetoacetate hydrolase family protein [Dietzia sp. PP-33]
MTDPDRSPSRARRRLIEGRPITEVMVDGVWAPWDAGARDPFGIPAGPARRDPAPQGAAGVGSDALLPFAPLSFRDFMLYEEHVIAASRGIARTNLPGAYRFTALYERVTGSTFPKFKPPALWYEQPIYYMSNALTFVSTETPVAAPAYADSLDYELELGFVLRAPLRGASPEEALEAIGGYVVLNDFSARNVQLKEMRSGFGPQKAKHFLSSMSADLVAAAGLDATDLGASVSVNGTVVATSSTRNPHHSIAEALAHASRGEQLYPGELFGTGTLPGCSGIEAGVRLHPGDVLELVIENVGTIRHSIAPGGHA